MQWYDGHPPEEPTEDMCMAIREKNDDLWAKAVHCYESGYAICYVDATTPGMGPSMTTVEGKRILVLSLENMCPDSFMQIGPECTSFVWKMDNSWNEGEKACNEKDGAHLIMIKYPHDMEFVST